MTQPVPGGPGLGSRRATAGRQGASVQSLCPPTWAGRAPVALAFFPASSSPHPPRTPLPTSHWTPPCPSIPVRGAAPELRQPRAPSLGGHAAGSHAPVEGRGHWLKGNTASASSRISDPSLPERAPPVAKVMGKEAWHTQRWDRASGVPLEILEHLPPKPESAYFLLCALTYTSDFRGGCPPLPL